MFGACGLTTPLPSHTVSWEPAAGLMGHPFDPATATAATVANVEVQWPACVEIGDRSWLRPEVSYTPWSVTITLHTTDTYAEKCLNRCRTCGTRFQVRSGGGFFFDLLHCEACGEAKSVGHQELGDIHLGFVKGLPGPYRGCPVGNGPPHPARVLRRAPDPGGIPRRGRGHARPVFMRRALPLRRSGPLPRVQVHQRAMGSRPGSARYVL